MPVTFRGLPEPIHAWLRGCPDLSHCTTIGSATQTTHNRRRGEERRPLPRPLPLLGPTQNQHIFSAEKEPSHTGLARLPMPRANALSGCLDHSRCRRRSPDSWPGLPRGLPDPFLGCQPAGQVATAPSATRQPARFTSGVGGKPMGPVLRSPGRLAPASGRAGSLALTRSNATAR